jgi:hypothetical protein
MTTTQLVITVWLSGWIICSIQYIISGIRKAKLFASCLNDNIYWSSIVLFSPLWPIVFIVYIWLYICTIFGRPLPDGVPTGMYSLKKRTQTKADK